MLTVFLLSLLLLRILPASLAATSVQVQTDAALLSALRNKVISEIVVAKNIKLGENGEPCKESRMLTSVVRVHRRINVELRQPSHHHIEERDHIGLLAIHANRP